MRKQRGEVGLHPFPCMDAECIYSRSGLDNFLCHLRFFETIFLCFKISYVDHKYIHVDLIYPDLKIVEFGL